MRVEIASVRYTVSSWSLVCHRVRLVPGGSLTQHITSATRWTYIYTSYRLQEVENLPPLSHTHTLRWTCIYTDTGYRK